ncbi:pyruvate kinase [Bacillus massilinigeriensis]|uniref:pyruvate kinase n=1 Tax=Bacillus massilionigeriensis TaxID=1805475 RepID=UPI0013565DAD|nr:pyruvate kinase [Bacillus massilionigeriensis]
MINQTYNQKDFSQLILNLYHQAINDSETLLEKYPIESRIVSRDNLLTYLAIMAKHNPKLEDHLVNHGFSSLNASNPHPLYTLKQILFHQGLTVEPPNVQVISPSDSKHLSKLHSEIIFGKLEEKLPFSIMVTLDAKMISQPALVESLLTNGMTIARINCAHDNELIWKELITLIRTTERKLIKHGILRNQFCKIYMDLAGPKIRIGKVSRDNQHQDSKKQKKIFVRKGDLLRLYLDSEKKGHPATNESPAGVPVTLVKAFKNVRINDRIYIDDGKIHGLVERIRNDHVDVRILFPEKRTAKIKEGKGLNLPDSLISLNLSSLTEKDMKDLAFITENADIVGISFVHSPLDLLKLREELERYSRLDIPVVAKIETKDAIHHLARIILEGLKFNGGFGIMIARGDLAVEVGLENLPFVQDEILNICKAAHTPTIWATSVLEGLTKQGNPTRSEMTDVAQGKRADCFMLNKGPYIVESLMMLKKILTSNQYFPPNNTIHRNLTVQYGFFKGIKEGAPLSE